MRVGAARPIARAPARLTFCRSASMFADMLRSLPAGFIAPCLPTKADTLPSGAMWLHEIKHDGFRVIARKDGDRVRLYSRPGNDMTRRFPLIVDALARLRSRSCIIDGEAVACDDNGVASFDRIRYRQQDASVFLYGFDLIELNGDDLRRDPLEVRKATLASIVAKAGPGIRFNEHIEGDGPTNEHTAYSRSVCLDVPSGTLARPWCFPSGALLWVSETPPEHLPLECDTWAGFLLVDESA
jgi:bifunctional non-homologous end joining protein LigD